MFGNELWDAISGALDTRHGDNGNDFHRKLIHPATVKLLNPQSGERILDIACGNGVFTRYLATLGVNVVAFDYSPKMIEYAKKRSLQYSDTAKFYVADATDYEQIKSLSGGKLFDKAVANMAVMGFPEISPLFKALYELLPRNGIFVFSITHPCFQTPEKDYTPDGNGLITADYISPRQYPYQILADNPKTAYHWHRPLQEILSPCFDSGFVLDGLEEPVFEQGACTHTVWENVPMALVLRLRKIAP